MTSTEKKLILIIVAQAILAPFLAYQAYRTGIRAALEALGAAL